MFARCVLAYYRSLPFRSEYGVNCLAVGERPCGVGLVPLSLRRMGSDDCQGPMAFVPSAEHVLPMLSVSTELLARVCDDEAHLMRWPVVACTTAACWGRSLGVLPSLCAGQCGPLFYIITVK